MSNHIIIKQGLRREHTSKNIEKVPRTPGVYKIFYGDKTIYVGVTGNLRKRLLELNGDPKIRFGTFSWYQTKSRADAETFEQTLKEQERASFSLLELSIHTFYNWNEKGILDLSPKFQRLKVWKPIAKSYFLDTIIRGLPSPHVYIRDILLPKGIIQHQVARWPVPKFITNKPYETNSRTHRTPNHPNTILHHSKPTISEETPTSASSPSPPRE